MDENAPIELQIETTADEAGRGLDSIASKLENVEASITGAASSLSKFKSEAAASAESVQKLKGASDRSFDAKRILEFTGQMMKYQQKAKQLSKSGNTDELAIGKAMSESAKEATRLNKKLNSMEFGTDKYKETEAALARQMNLLSDLSVEYDKLNAKRFNDASASVGDAIFPQVDAFKKVISDIEGLVEDAQKLEAEGHKGHGMSVRRTANRIIDEELEGKADPTIVKHWRDQVAFDPSFFPEEKKAPDFKVPLSQAEKLAEKIKEIANLKIETPKDLEKALKAYERFVRAAQTNKENIVKYNAAGDDEHAQKEAKKLAANEAAANAYRKAIRGATVAWDEFSDGDQVELADPKKYIEAQKHVENLRRKVDRLTSSYVAAREASDVVGAGKIQEKLNRTKLELGVNETALEAFAPAFEQAKKALAESGEIKITNPDELREAEQQFEKLSKKVQKYTADLNNAKAAGDFAGVKKAEVKLADAKSGQANYKAALDAASDIRNQMREGSEIEIFDYDSYKEAEQYFKKLQKEVSKYALELKRAKAAGDDIAIGKFEEKLKGSTAERDRVGVALEDASDIKRQVEQLESLEDVYKKIDKMRSQISDKGVMGRTDFNSPALRKLKLDLTDAEISAVRLKRELGELSGGQAMAQSMGLVAKRTIQARIHMRLLDHEAKKANRSLIQMSRVLQLMAVRMGVRYVLKDMKAGFVALAQEYEPFNEALSSMMDASTQLRNNLVSAFQPLINAIAPAAVNAISAIADVAEKTAQAIAAMTGQDYYVKLTSEAQDFAKANEEAKNSLAGFDKFNTIGSTGGKNGEKFKTEVEEIPVPESMKKWKQIGDGIKEVFKGIGHVIESIIGKFKKWLGLADNADAFKTIGDWLKGAGQWIQKNSDGIAKWVIAIGAAKLALNILVGGFLKIYNMVKTIKDIKSVFGIGKAVTSATTTAGTSAATGGLLTKAATGLKTALAGAGTVLKTKLAAAGTFFSAKATAAGTALKGAGTVVSGKLAAIGGGSALAGGATVGGTVAGAAGVLSGLFDTVKAIRAEGKERSEYGWSAASKIGMVGTGAGIGAAIGSIIPGLGTAVGAAVGAGIGGIGALWKGKDVGKFISDKVYDNKRSGVMNTGSSMKPVTYQTPQLDQSGIIEGVTAGVEKAFSKVFKQGGNNVNVTIRANADTDRLFRFVVDQNNAAYNRTGRSPLKV